jgi:guanylate kinase
MASRGEFLEYADVFGNLYGTSAADTERALASGNDVVLVIDVQGAQQVRRRGLESVAVFVLPPSYDVLERRLRSRSEDGEETMRRRLRTARHEVAAYEDYDYVVVNDEVDASVDRLRGIVIAERARLRPMLQIVEPIVDSFASR